MTPDEYIKQYEVAEIKDNWINRELIRANRYRETGRYSRDYIRVPENYTTPEQVIKHLSLPDAVLEATKIYFQDVLDIRKDHAERGVYHELSKVFYGPEYCWLGRVEPLLRI